MLSAPPPLTSSGVRGTYPAAQVSEASSPLAIPFSILHSTAPTSAPPASVRNSSACVAGMCAPTVST
mgnify:CR=1 FL=1